MTLRRTVRGEAQEAHRGHRQLEADADPPPVVGNHLSRGLELFEPVGRAELFPLRLVRPRLVTVAQAPPYRGDVGVVGIHAVMAQGVRRTSGKTLDGHGDGAREVERAGRL